MDQFVPCQSCGKLVNRFLPQCPYCGSDPGGDRSDSPEPVQGVVGGPPRQGEFRPLESVALFVRLLFGLIIVGSVGVVTTAWSYRSALLEIAAGRPIAIDDALLAEERYEAVSFLVGGANIALAIAFVVWFWRAYANLAALGRPRKRKAGWAIGAWFIPIGNFFIPYGIGAEVWKQSSAMPGDSEPNMEPVISWWALFLMMGLVNQIAFFTRADALEDPERMAAVVGLDVLSSVLAVAAAVAAMRFVRLATEKQQRAATSAAF